MSKSPKTSIATSKSGLGHQLRQFKINQLLSRRCSSEPLTGLVLFLGDDDKYPVSLLLLKQQTAVEGSCPANRPIKPSAPPAMPPLRGCGAGCRTGGHCVGRTGWLTRGLRSDTGPRPWEPSAFPALSTGSEATVGALEAAPGSLGWLGLAALLLRAADSTSSEDAAISNMPRSPVVALTFQTGTAASTGVSVPSEGR